MKLSSPYYSRDNFFLNRKCDIRLNGIDTPEINGQCEKETYNAEQAKERAADILKDAERIDLKNMERDKNFRIVADVYADDFQDGIDVFKQKDYKTALKKWKPLAEQEHAKAQFNLGKMYDKGQGVTQGYVQAHKWFNLAGASGHEEGSKTGILLRSE